MLVEAMALTEGLEIPRMLLCEGIDFVGRRIAHVVDGTMVLLLKKRDLKGQYGEAFVDILAELADAPFLPRPYLGEDVVVDGDVSVAMDKLGHAEIKSRIVYQDGDIGPPAQYEAPAHLHRL